MSAQLEEMLSELEESATDTKTQGLMMVPLTAADALSLIAAIRSALAPLKYVCENCDTTKEHHNPECQQPDWRCVNPSAALAPGTGEMPELDYSCATTSMMAERDVEQYSDDLLRGLATNRTETLSLRERQLRASTAEVHRLRELISEADFEGGSLVYASDHKKIVERERASGMKQGRRGAGTRWRRQRSICARCAGMGFQWITFRADSFMVRTPARVRGMVHGPFGAELINCA